MRIKLFENFLPKLTENDIYLLLADFIEEDNYDITIQKWYSRNIIDIAYKMKIMDKDIFEDIIDKLIDHKLYVVADSVYGETTFGINHDYIKITMSNSKEEVENMLAGSPSTFELKNK